MPLPTFLIIGASKCGTTSLYHYLRQHPDVFMSPVKEPNFFAFHEAPPQFRGPRDDERINRLSITDGHAYRALFEAARPNQARGEASHWYLYHPDAARTIYAMLPEARLVALLRDPAERAYASYWYMRQQGRETLPTFMDALRAEPERIAAGWAWGHYVQRGYYARQLRRYDEHFPARQLRVYLFDDLQRDAAALVADVCCFVGARADVPLDVTTRYNPSGEPRSRMISRLLNRRHPLRTVARAWLPDASWARLRRLKTRVQRWNVTKPPMSAEARAYLAGLYRDDVRRLQDRLQRDLTAWLRPESWSAAP